MTLRRRNRLPASGCLGLEYLHESLESAKRNASTGTARAALAAGAVSLGDRRNGRRIYRGGADRPLRVA